MGRIFILSRCNRILEDMKNGVVIDNSLGKPPIILDWDYIAKLCQCGCSGKEVADWIGVSCDTLYERCCRDNGMLWTRFSSMHKHRGDGNIRRRQYEVAMDGDRVMLIWLGKQRLGQRENPISTEEMPAHIKEFIDLIKAQYAPINDVKEKQENPISSVSADSSNSSDINETTE